MEQYSGRSAIFTKRLANLSDGGKKEEIPRSLTPTQEIDCTQWAMGSSLRYATFNNLIYFNNLLGNDWFGVKNSKSLTFNRAWRFLN